MSVIRYTGAGKIVVPRFRDIPTHVPRLNCKVRRSRWKRVLSSLHLKLYLHVRLRLKIDPTALPAYLPFCGKLAVRQVKQ